MASTKHHACQECGTRPTTNNGAHGGLPICHYCRRRRKREEVVCSVCSRTYERVRWGNSRTAKTCSSECFSAHITRLNLGRRGSVSITAEQRRARWGADYLEILERTERVARSRDEAGLSVRDLIKLRQDPSFAAQERQIREAFNG